MKYLSPITILAASVTAGMVMAANTPNLQALDANGDHAISTSEALQGGLSLLQFQAMDKNKDGTLTSDEMDGALQTPDANTQLSAPGEPGAVVGPDSGRGHPAQRAGVR